VVDVRGSGPGADRAPDGSEHKELVLAPRTASVAVARHALDDLPVPEDVADDVRLLVSELVTNSVRHAGLAEHEPIQIVIDLRKDSVRVEVCDAGPGFDPRRAPGSDETSGWGLRFLAHLASRWGVTDRQGTCVWFEISSAGDEPAASD